MAIRGDHDVHRVDQVRLAQGRVIPDLNRPDVVVAFRPVREGQRGGDEPRPGEDVVLDEEHPIVPLDLEEVSTRPDQMAADAIVLRATDEAGIRHLRGFDDPNDPVLIGPRAPIEIMVDLDSVQPVLVRTQRFEQARCGLGAVVPDDQQCRPHPLALGSRAPLVVDEARALNRR